MVDDPGITRVADNRVMNEGIAFYRIFGRKIKNMKEIQSTCMASRQKVANIGTANNQLINGGYRASFGVCEKKQFENAKGTRKACVVSG